MAKAHFFIATNDRIAGRYATVYKAGARLAAAASASTSITVHAVHGVSNGDKLVYGLTRTNVGVQVPYTAADVSSSLDTTITVSPALTAPAESVLVNLEADTGLTLQSDGSYTLPEFDGSTVTIYSDPNGDVTITNSTVTMEAGGEISFYADAGTYWIIVHDFRKRIVRVYPDIGPNPTSTVAGPVSSTDNAIARFDGTSGAILQDYSSNAPTISDAGAVTIPSTLNVDGAVDFDAALDVAGAVTMQGAATVGTTLGVSGATTISHAAPSAAGWTLADANAVALSVKGASDVTLFSFVPLQPDDANAILMRVGDRAMTAGDSRVLGFFSGNVDSPGATESQALYGINLYTGSGTGTQIGVHGMGQSIPGNGATQTAVSGVQGVSSHLDTAGGTSTTLTGVNGTVQTGSGASYTGVAQNMFGVRGNAQHRSTNVTTTQMFGVYGLCSDVSASGVTTAAGARFDQASNATNSHAVVVYGNPIASLSFTDDLSTFRYLRWSTANTRFELSSNVRIAGTINSTGNATFEGTASAITVGANTDADVSVKFNTLTTEGNFTYKGASSNNFNFDRPVEFKTTAGITASTTQTQVGGTALTSEINEVSTCANANDTVTLPSAVAGMRCIVINNGAQTLQIFPASGDNLGAGADTATTLAAGSNLHLVAYDATNWETV